jgi:hypothetical protein
VIHQCDPAGECTWQVRRGLVEVGSKSRLSGPDARTLRIYYVRDLTKSRSADELISRIVREIEPGHWIVGTNEEADYAETPGPTRDTGLRQRSSPNATPGAKAATIQYRDGGLIIRAPEFIHRQLDDYLRADSSRPMSPARAGDRPPR